jgi:hypothetical protein
MTGTLLDLIEETAEKLARKHYKQSYQEFIAVEQDEIWTQAVLIAEEAFNKLVKGYR